MGEIARVDLERLRSLADRITAVAGDVTELRPTALGDGLIGSAAAAAAQGAPSSAGRTPAPGAAQLGELPWPKFLNTPCTLDLPVHIDISG